MQQAGVVYNATSGTIRSTGGINADAVFEGSGGGTLTNHGTIVTNTASGNGVVFTSSGGTISNYGLIQAYDFGVNMEAAGFITNSGTIRSTGEGRSAVQLASDGTLVNQGSIISSLFAQSGVQGTGSGDTVTNSGFIQGYFIGLQLAGVGTVMNSGTIRSLERGVFFGEADVVMPSGGSFTNTQTGYVTNGVILNVANDGVGADSTVVNAGTILGGVYLNAESSGHYGTGTLFDSGTISAAPATFAVYFGGTNALLVLEHGYHINGKVDTLGTFPHTVELLGTSGAPVTVSFSPTSFTNFGTVAFAAGSGNDATLALAGSVDIPGTISGFTGPLDVIDLQYITDTNNDATAILNTITNKLTVTGDNGSTVLQLDPSFDYAGITFDAISDGNGGTDVHIACFYAGTLISTPAGEVPVEQLRIGDLLITRSGKPRALKWIGRRSYAGWFAARNPKVMPVCFKAGSLAHEVPQRDLWMSPEHAVYLDGALVPAGLLVNGISILKANSIEEVHYFHLEFDTHDVIIAEGALTESFVDDDSRGMFHNAAEFYTLYPDEPTGKPARFCAPRVEDGFALEEVRRKLLSRAAPPLVNKAEPTAPFQTPGPLQGSIDVLQSTRVVGWAHDPGLPDASVSLVVLSNGAEIGRVVADRFRRDLLDAGMGAEPSNWSSPAALQRTSDT
jgi:hypothetical protein